MEYCQVPESDTSCYEFRWGPGAYAETTKKKILEFLPKLNNTVPSTFSSHYEEALREEEERAQARGTARAGISTTGRNYPLSITIIVYTPTKI